MDPQQLASAYDRGTFGVSRRAFLKLAAVTGVSAAAGMLVFPEQQAAAAFTQPAAPNWPPLSGDKIRFTVHSDTHVGASPNNNYRDKIPEAILGHLRHGTRRGRAFLRGRTRPTPATRTSTSSSRNC